MLEQKKVFELHEALTEGDLLLELSKACDEKISLHIAFPYYKCWLAAILGKVCLGLNIVKGTYKFPTKEAVSEFMQRIVDAATPEVRQGIRGLPTHPVYLRQYVEDGVEHWFNQDPNTEEWVDISHEQFDPNSGLYIARSIPSNVESGVVTVEGILPEESDIPMLREQIVSVCGKAGLVISQDS